MTLTLPTPDAGDTARQRFALELLLQQPVPGPEQLLASRNLLSDALPDVSPDQWRALQAMPIAIGADHLDIAIPSQWRDQGWRTSTKTKSAPWSRRSPRCSSPR